jgi:hypothetical protein
MKLAIKRFFLVYLATYFLVGNLGISLTQSTCLFTGNTKYSFDRAVSCCSKNAKSNFNQTANKIPKIDFNLHDFHNSSYSIGKSNGLIAFKKLSYYFSNHSPPPLGTRLANLQAYLI